MPLVEAPNCLVNDPMGAALKAIGPSGIFAMLQQPGVEL